eukprot:3420397-Rhodomonas_salina.1
METCTPGYPGSGSLATAGPWSQAVAAELANHAGSCGNSYTARRSQAPPTCCNAVANLDNFTVTGTLAVVAGFGSDSNETKSEFRRAATTLGTRVPRVARST